MKALIADDHALFREGLSSFLLGIGLVEQTLEVEDFAAALACLDEHRNIGLVLTDLCMPGMNGAQSIALMVEKAAPAPVAVISASEERSLIRNVIDAGAAGCISKAASTDILQHALHIILSGGVYLPNRSVLVANETAPDSPLSARQMEILTLLAEGMSNKEVARELGVSEGTVKQLLIDIYVYLGVNNRTRAIVAARKMGLLS